MRARKFSLFVFALILTALLARALSKPTKPAVKFEVLGYTYYATGALAHLRVTNIGSTPVRRGMFGFTDGWLFVKTVHGWERQRELGGSINLINPGWLLEPAGKMEFGIGIHGEASQWCLEYKVQSASAREQALAKLDRQWLKRLQSVCERMFSDQPMASTKVWSDVFDLSNCVQAHAGATDAELDLNAISEIPVHMQTF